MGVPGFYSWILYNFSFIYKKQLPIEVFNTHNFNVYKGNSLKTKIDYLFFDANCLIHYVCNKIISSSNNLSLSDLENNIITQIIHLLDTLVKIIQPNVLLYISIDGTVPIAKVDQQKIRRYKTLIDREIKLSLKEKMDLNYNTNIKWSSAFISPGTSFMEKLDKEFKSYIENKKSLYGKNITIIYSGSNCPGEGEQKIMSYIREYCLPTNKILVYGLDADLIYLCLTITNRNLYIMREGNDTDDNYSIISIDDVRQLLYDIFTIKSDVMIKKTSYYYFMLNKSGAGYNMNIKWDGVINDFVFISFLLGNDFIPGSFCLSVKMIKKDKEIFNGIDIIILLYYLTKLKYPHRNILSFDPKISIDYEVFLYYISLFKYIEKDLISDNYNYDLNKSIKLYDTAYEKNANFILKIDNQDIDLLDEKNMEILNIKNKINKLDLVKKMSREQKNIFDNYNTYCFDKTTPSDEILYDYLYSFYWTINYYFFNNPDWFVYYRHNYSPLFTDIYDYLITNKKILSTMEDKILTIPKNNNMFIIKPVEHLCLILPPQLFYILPDKYRNILLEHFSYIYETHCNLKINILAKNKLWQCNPIIPDYDIISILKVLKTLDRTEIYENNDVVISTITI